MHKPKRRRRKLVAVQYPGDAGAWTIVEMIGCPRQRRPIMVVSDIYRARKMMRAIAMEGRG